MCPTARVIELCRVVLGVEEVDSILRLYMKSMRYYHITIRVVRIHFSFLRPTYVRNHGWSSSRLLRRSSRKQVSRASEINCRPYVTAFLYYEYCISFIDDTIESLTCSEQYHCPLERVLPFSRDSEKCSFLPYCSAACSPSQPTLNRVPFRILLSPLPLPLPRLQRPCQYHNHPPPPLLPRPATFSLAPLRAPLSPALLLQCRQDPTSPTVTRSLCLSPPLLRTIPEMPQLQEVVARRVPATLFCWLVQTFPQPQMLQLPLPQLQPRQTQRRVIITQSSVVGNTQT